MKTHHLFSGLSLWRDPAVLARAVRPERLAFARIEPVTRTRQGSAIIDLTFDDGGRPVIVPLVQVDVNRILQRDGDVLIWPAAAAGPIDSAAAAAIDDRLREWLEDLSFGRTLNRETWCAFEPSAIDFARARGLDLLGAAPFERVVLQIAPYLYARRFARDAMVAIDDAGAAAGVAILQTTAAMVDVATSRNDDAAFAKNWFNVAPGPIRGGAAYDVTIADRAATEIAAPGRIASIALDDGTYGVPVPVVQPSPLDLFISYDAADAPTLRTFGVVAAARETRPSRVCALPQMAGGSTGRLLFLVRQDAATAPDADIDGIRVLATSLRSEGLTVDVRSTAGDLRGVDLVHLFADDDLAHAVAEMRPVREARIPYVVSIGQAMVPDDVYHAIEKHVFITQAAGHESQSAAFVKALTGGTLSVDGGEAPMEIASRVAARAEYRALLAEAQAVLVPTSADRNAIEAAYGPGVRIAIAALPLLASPAVPVEAHAGSAPFILVAGPFEPQMNQLTVARALRDASMPVVFAGAVADIGYLEKTRLHASSDAIFLTDPPAELVRSLFNGAAVVLDASLIPRGLAVPLRGAIEGASIIVAAGSSAAALFGEEALQCQPLSEHSIRDTVAQATSGPGRERRIARCTEIALAASAPAATLGVVLAAYAAVAQTALS